MIKDFYSPLLSISGFSITVAGIGTAISIIAGTLTAVYTALKIYDWVQERRKKD